MNDERTNLNFAEKTTQWLSLEADLNFVLGNSLQKQLFPEYGKFRDICLLWKWSLCPNEQARNNRPSDPIVGILYKVDPINRKIDVLAGGNELFENVLPARIPISGLAFPSRTDPAKFAGSDVFSENDVLYKQSLPDFGGMIGQRDSELLISYLTVPYIRIPLLMQLFSSEDRMNSLKNPDLQTCLLYSLTECHQYVPLYIMLNEEARLPRDVPCSNPSLIGTSHGLLLNELQHSPKAILGPLKIMVCWAIEKSYHSVHDGAFEAVLFIARLAARVVNVGEFLISVWNGETIHTELPYSLECNKENKETLEEMINELKELLVEGTPSSSSEEKGRCSDESSSVLTLSENLVSRLVEIEQSSKIFCASGSSHAAFSSYSCDIAEVKSLGSDGSSSVLSPNLLSHDIEELNKKYCASESSQSCETPKRVIEGEAADDNSASFYMKMRNLIHAHIILLYGSTKRAGKNISGQNCIVSMSSTFFFTNNHTWNAKSLPLSESELITAIDQIRISAYQYLELLAENDEPEFVNACQKIYERVSCDAPRKTTTWKRVSGMKGKYVMLASTSLQRSAKFVRNSRYPVELDLNTIEMRVHGGTMVLLDEEIAGNRDVRYLLGMNLGSLQCVHISNTSVCRQRKMIGTRTPVYIHAWSEEREMQDVGDYLAEYDPAILDDGDCWISEMFEPIRTKFFKKDVNFFLDSSRNSNSKNMATLCGVHEETGGAWFEVVLLKQIKTIHVFQIESYGRNFYRRLCYTNNSMQTFYQFQPDTKSPRVPWEPWARYEAGDPEMAEPPFSASCTIYRPVPTSVHEERYRSENPLHSAAEAGNTEILKHLIDCGADIMKTDSMDRSVLDVACLHESRDAVSIIGKHMVQIDGKGNVYRSLLNAVLKGNKSVVNRLVDVIANTDDMLDPATCEEICKCFVDFLAQKMKIGNSIVKLFM